MLKKINHIGPTNTWLKSCVNWFARSTYSSTTPQVKHSKGLPLAIVVGLSVVSVPASAETVMKNGFFDFQAAVEKWSNPPSTEEIDAVLAKCEKGAYTAWKRAHKSLDPAKQTLEGNPIAAEIKGCHDLDKLTDIWTNIYGVRYKTLTPQPWNETTDWVICNSIKSKNIFTGRCNDQPDWRDPAWRESDDNKVAAYRALKARQASSK